MSEMKGKTVWRKAGGFALRAAAILLLAAGLLLIGRSLVNRIFLFNCGSGRYSEYPEKILLPLRLGDDYTVPYNLGIVAYQKEDYTLAARYFDSALSMNPPEDGKACSVRINLALSLLHGYPFDCLDMRDREQIQKALDVLYSARAVLTENGCADKDAATFGGHSRDAEKLKQDIDEMIRRLSSPPPSSAQNGGGEQDGGKDGEDGENGEDSRDETEDDSRAQAGLSEEERQQALKDQLMEQKKELDTDSYQSTGAAGFTYVSIGDTTGFGEGAPW